MTITHSPSRTSAKIALYGNVALVLAFLALFVFRLIERDAYMQALDGDIQGLVEIVDTVIVESWPYSLTLGIAVFCAIAFGIWVNRANKSLHDMGVYGMSYTPRWASLWFIIPFANIFMPVRVLWELWKASDPDTPINAGDAGRSSKGTTFIGLWWIAGFISLWLIRFSTKIDAEIEINGLEGDIPSALKASMMDVLELIPAIMVCCLTIWIIYNIELRIAEKYKLETMSEDSNANGSLLGYYNQAIKA